MISSYGGKFLWKSRISHHSDPFFLSLKLLKLQPGHTGCQIGICELIFQILRPGIVIVTVNADIDIPFVKPCKILFSGTGDN